MAGIIRKYKNLVDMCQAVDKEYFDRLASSKSSETFERIWEGRRQFFFPKNITITDQSSPSQSVF